MTDPNDQLPEGFDQFVKEHIEPLFAALQQQRAHARKSLRKYGLIGMCIGIGAAGIAFFVFHLFWAIVVGVLVAPGFLGLIPGTMQLAKAKDAFGQQHLVKITEFLGLSYQDAGFEPPKFEIFTQLDLVPAGHRRSFTHLVGGAHQGLEFTVYEAHIEERRTRTRTHSNGRTTTETYWVTVFNGQLLHSPYARKFASTTVIARDKGWFNTKGRFGKTMKPMGLADPEFEKLFEVYTTDQVEGRFLVDPIFMLRLLELEDKYKNRKPTAAFFEQGVFVALHGGTEFFGKLDKHATATGLARQTVTAFSHIFHFLEMLKGKNHQ